MSDYGGFNEKIIDEFRSNEGKVGGPFEGARLLLLHSKGRKSGKEYVNPVTHQEVDGNLAIFGSKGGKRDVPQFAEYERATTGLREIPVIILEK